MKRSAPPALRNREPIREVLADELPSSGTVLEIAAGTGEHAVHFAAAFPGLIWQPTDPDAEALASIAAWREESGLANLLPPVQLDASVGEWPFARVDALYCCNMAHISPVAATEGLVAAAGRLLPEGGPLIFYGPWLEDDVETTDSNMAFDVDLKSRNPLWGLRRREWLDGLASANGLKLTRRVAMPANNLMLVYRQHGSGQIA